MSVNALPGTERPPLMPERTYTALKSQAVEMEGLFINTLIAQMFSSIDTESAFSGGQAEETWRGMMAEQYSQSVAEAGGFGLAEPILRDLIAIQGNTSAPAASQTASQAASQLLIDAPQTASQAASQLLIDAAIGAYAK